MAGKGKRRASKNSDKIKERRKSEGKAVRKSEKKSRCNVDIFSEAAMDNAYYICHNVQDLLKYRGFPWPDAQKKKKKGGKGGKKKK